MAVNVDTVYQRVLAIANKEQRGYITPQEFNLFANQAQMSIFEQYFYDHNQFGRLPGNSSTYSDMIPLLEEKMFIFKKRHQPITIVNNFGDGVLPTDVYRLGMVMRYTLTNDTLSKQSITEIEQVTEEEYAYLSATPLAKPTKYRPIYIRKNATTIKIYPYGEDVGNDNAAVLRPSQTGQSQFGGQFNQFNAVGVTPLIGSGQAVASKTQFFTPNASSASIKVGQIVTGTNVLTVPPTTVVSVDHGPLSQPTTVGNIATETSEMVVSSATNIKIGQLIVSSGANAFSPLSVVTGVQGSAVYFSPPTINANATNGTTINFFTTVVFNQLPAAALSFNAPITFSENSLSYLEEGMTVSNSALADGTTVLSIIGSKITLSNDFTAGGNRTLTFSSDDIKCNYIRKPIDVSWGYSLVNNAALYLSSNSTNFELHESEETSLVMKILSLAGIAIKDPSIYQIAVSEEQRTLQQEKQ